MERLAPHFAVKLQEQRWHEHYSNSDSFSSSSA